FAKVAAEIERLPDPYRTTLILRHYERLPGRVIAKRLGIPIGTVTMRLSRRHRMLREAIARPTLPAWRTCHALRGSARPARPVPAARSERARRDSTSPSHLWLPELLRRAEARPPGAWRGRRLCRLPPPALELLGPGAGEDRRDAIRERRVRAT